MRENKNRTKERTIVVIIICLRLKKIYTNFYIVLTMNIHISLLKNKNYICLYTCLKKKNFKAR